MITTPFYLIIIDRSRDILHSLAAARAAVALCASRRHAQAWLSQSQTHHTVAAYGSEQSRSGPVAPTVGNLWLSVQMQWLSQWRAVALTRFLIPEFITLPTLTLPCDSDVPPESIALRAQSQALHMDPLTCICGRTFPLEGALSNHRHSCQKSKKRLFGALGKAKEILVARKRPRPSTSGGSSLPEHANPLDSPMNRVDVCPIELLPLLLRLILYYSIRNPLLLNPVRFLPEMQAPDRTPAP